ncbi:MAG: polysaccharide export protein [Cytophagales bacterium]|nr:MAG: polysaccharide export protein [Cytophagales bacterium]
MINVKYNKNFVGPTRTRTILLLCVAGLHAILTGCLSAQKITYFQSGPNVALGSTNRVAMPDTYIPTIKPSDVLSIQVSSLNPEASVMFNPYTPMSMASATRNSLQSNVNGLPEAPGYLVLPDGQVDLPLIGIQKVGGLTVSDAAKLIREKLKTYLKEPTVNVRNLTFRVSVLGEVARPSLFTVPNDQITLLEALSLAGDITIYGRRENVLVIREENGEKVFARIDLTSRDLFRSPYYYLHPNDVVYVEPGKARISNASQFYQLAPTILSALSFIAIIITSR